MSTGEKYGDISIGKRNMDCDEIQGLLFDYMTRELGQARSDLVREHLRKCEKCQTAARETGETLDLLQTAKKVEEGAPAKLSEDRRRRVMRSVMHPVMHWMETNHIIVSVIVAIVLILCILMVLAQMKIMDDKRKGHWIDVQVDIDGRTLTQRVERVQEPPLPLDPPSPLPEE
jgi:predicted anti-sigma-YlaC factor YlaD